MSSPSLTKPIKSRKLWKRRACILTVYAALLITAFMVILLVFQDNVVFYYSPKDLLEQRIKVSDNLIRIGGLVKSGSIKKGSAKPATTFIITDFVNDVEVHYQGLLPTLFKEGQGTVALGKLADDGTFIAIEVLAKHDENYIPKEVAETLKQSGYWKE